MTEVLSLSIKAANQFFYFAMNYPHDFIQKVWNDAPWLAEHLQSKFNVMHEKRGSYGVMMDFYAELDGTNRVKLLEWVMSKWDSNFTTGLSKSKLFPEAEVQS